MSRLLPSAIKIETKNAQGKLDVSLVELLAAELSAAEFNGTIFLSYEPSLVDERLVFIVATLRDACPTSSIFVGCRSVDLSDRTIQLLSGFEVVPLGECDFHTSVLAIKPPGDVFLDGRIIGNINFDELSEIWLSSSFSPLVD